MFGKIEIGFGFINTSVRVAVIFNQVGYLEIASDYGRVVGTLVGQITFDTVRASE